VRRLVAFVTISAFAVGLVQGAAQGAAEARKTAVIPIPSDGNAAVAHLVLKATPKKGKKPKKPVARPRLKVTKAPKGVAVVAASYQRDAKNKNVWHATVALTNPYSKPLRRTASAQNPGDDGVVGIGVVETDDAYVVVILQVQIEQDVTNAQQPAVMPWVVPFCDPPGSMGDLFLAGPRPEGVSASDFLEYLCDLGVDGPADFDVYDELDLSGLVFDLDPFPGNPNEAYLRFEGVNVPPFNGAAFRFPGHSVVAQLPPQGYGGVVTPETVTWGNRNMPFPPGQVYRGNVRLDVPFDEDEVFYGQFTTTGGPPYSMPFAGHFTAP
jgi:hypothetical protein